MQRFEERCGDLQLKDSKKSSKLFKLCDLNRFMAVPILQAYCCGRKKTIAAAETAGDFRVFLQSLPTIHSSHQYLEQMHWFEATFEM